MRKQAALVQFMELVKAAKAQKIPNVSGGSKNVRNPGPKATGLAAARTIASMPFNEYENIISSTTPPRNVRPLLNSIMRGAGLSEREIKNEWTNPRTDEEIAGSINPGYMQLIEKILYEPMSRYWNSTTK